MEVRRAEEGGCGEERTNAEEGIGEGRHREGEGEECLEVLALACRSREAQLLRARYLESVHSETREASLVCLRDAS